LGAGVDPGFYIGVSPVMYFVTVISVRVCTPCALPLDLPLGVGEASPTKYLLCGRGLDIFWNNTNDMLMRI